MPGKPKVAAAAMPPAPPAQIQFHQVKPYWVEGTNILGACVKAVKKVLGPDVNQARMSQLVTLVYQWKGLKMQENANGTVRIEVTKELQEAIADAFIKKGAVKEPAAEGPAAEAPAPPPAPEAPVEEIDAENFEEGSAKIQVAVTGVTVKSRLEDLGNVLRPFQFALILEEGADMVAMGGDSLLLTVWPLKHIEARDEQVQALEDEYQLPFKETKKLDDYGAITMDGNSDEVAIISGPTPAVLESIAARLNMLFGE